MTELPKPFDKPDGYYQDYQTGDGRQGAGMVLSSQKLRAQKAPISPANAQLVFTGRFYCWVRNEILKMNDWLGNHPEGGKYNIDLLFFPAHWPFDACHKPRVIEEIIQSYGWSGWDVTLLEKEADEGHGSVPAYLVFTPKPTNPKPPSQGPFR